MSPQPIIPAILAQMPGIKRSPLAHVQLFGRDLHVRIVESETTWDRLVFEVEYWKGALEPASAEPAWVAMSVEAWRAWDGHNKNYVNAHLNAGETKRFALKFCSVSEHIPKEDFLCFGFRVTIDTNGEIPELSELNNVAELVHCNVSW